MPSFSPPPGVLSMLFVLQGTKAGACPLLLSSDCASPTGHGRAAAARRRHGQEHRHLATSIKARVKVVEATSTRARRPAPPACSGRVFGRSCCRASTGWVYTWSLHQLRPARARPSCPRCSLSSTPLPGPLARSRCPASCPAPRLLVFLRACVAVSTRRTLESVVRGHWPRAGLLARTRVCRLLVYPSTPARWPARLIA